ncbi:MAG: methylated-DNA--[protein]-cysteine S-methyltransferase [Methylococcaceae bacterium]|nr:methylated-DNA--[protein]-cysteine S-methyltransferase [Methylococcaceae bacterium]
MALTIVWVDGGADGVTETFKISTPIAHLLLACQQGVIVAADWLLAANCAYPDHELQGYFTQANPQAEITVKLLKQGSAYRHKVWAEMGKIPYGSTLSYAALAKNIGSSARAVGNACRDNPYPLIIPCHRVVSANGLGGYCGATQGDYIALKTHLLAIEAQHKP